MNGLLSAVGGLVGVGCAALVVAALIVAALVV